MSIEAIRTELVTLLSAINGVKRVYHDLPNVQPTAADCPCIVLAYQTPGARARADSGAVMQYEWLFDVHFLYKPLGLGNPDENVSGAEDFIKLFVDELAGNITGSGAWDDWNKDSGTLEFTVGVVEQGAENYWGWTCPLDIKETVTTTFDAG